MSWDPTLKLVALAYLRQVRHEMSTQRMLSSTQAQHVWPAVHCLGCHAMHAFCCHANQVSIALRVVPPQVHVFRAQPMFESVGTLAVASATSAVWSVRQLYIATPTSVLLAFVSAPESTVGALMDLGGPSGPEECNMQVGMPGIMQHVHLKYTYTVDEG